MTRLRARLRYLAGQGPWAWACGIVAAGLTLLLAWRKGGLPKESE